MEFTNVIEKFWEKYRSRYMLYSGLTAALFLLQIIHLYWLTTHVVTFRLFGTHFFQPNDFWQLVIIFVDYTEIPAIISTSLLYLHSLSQKWNWKDVTMLVLLNSQWLHLFWISDEFVEAIFLGGATATVLPVWLAWVAITIDYLELPVMYDVVKKFLGSWKQASVAKENV